MHDLYPGIKVQQQEHDPSSVLAICRRVLRLRKEHKHIFIYGAFELLQPEDESVFVFRKTAGPKRALVALNFTAEPRSFERKGGEKMRLADKQLREWSECVRRSAAL
jgi:alpha-glucosidase